MLQNSLDAAQRLDHVRAVIVQIPQFPVVPLMRPPKRILLQYLILLKVGPNSPSLIIGQRVPILLEQRIDPRDPAIPTVLQILQRQPAILRICLLPLQRILRPNPL